MRQSANITTNCYDLVDISGNVCPASGPTSTTCVPVRVQVTLSKTVTTLFGGIIGKRHWVVQARARALKSDAVRTVSGTVITVDGVVTTTPDIVTTTPDIVVTTDGTVSTIPGTVTTIPGTVTTTPETVTTGPDVTVTTPGKPGQALLFAKSQACDAIDLQTQGGKYKGGLVSNGGADAGNNGARDIRADSLVYGNDATSGCLR